MFCRQCGNTIPDTVRFCIHCGAPISGGERAPVPEPVPEYAPAPETPRGGTPPLRPSRTFVLICVLALIAAFGCGMIAGFLVGSAVAEAGPPAVPTWAATPVQTGRNSGNHLYAAFDVTAGTDAGKLYVVIETVQDGVLLRSGKSDEEGRVFPDVEAGDTLRVKLFTDYDKFAPVDRAFTARNGDVYRQGKRVPLDALLNSGLTGNVYSFYFYDGRSCVGQCTLTIDFE